MTGQRYSKRNVDGLYTVDGLKYPSVTTILGVFLKEYLMFWSAKMASMKCVLPLVQSGVLTLKDLTYINGRGEVRPDEKLMQFVRDHTERTITKAEAIAEIRNWRMNMKEFERYRDFKASVGSLGHHAFYEYAIRDHKPCSDNELEGWLTGQAWDNEICHYIDEEGNKKPPTDAMLLAVVTPAIAYVHSAWEWIEIAKPKFVNVGLEAVIVKRKFTMSFGDTEIEFPGWAGTEDFECELNKSTYGYDWLWEGHDTVQTLGDLKTSNSLPETVREQMAAYNESNDIVIMSDNGTSADIIPKEARQFVSCLHVGPHPKYSDTSTEFGELESKTNQLGPKLYSWTRDPITYASFLGKCVSWWGMKHQSAGLDPVNDSLPKPKVYKKTEARPNPFELGI